MYKQVQYKIKGMNKDLSDSAFNSEFAFENRNIRITTLEGNTTLSVVNEKGTLPLKLTGEGISDNIIQGNVLGYSVINDILILFTTTSEKDSIYQIEIGAEDTLSVKLLYTGDLNFSSEHLIETLSVYENENNIKVYWVDGYNQPRVINIKDASQLNDNSFDFVPVINNLGTTKITVLKNYSSGTFPAGTIQYCFTYYNKNRQETNIVDVSPLYYTSHMDRGENPEDTVSNSFSISVSSAEKFQYVRIYSILRTSLNATPICKVVADLPLDGSSASIIDTGNIGYTIDPTELLYIGGEVISANTITQKDNTLFLGNLFVNKFRVNDIILEKEVGKPTIEHALQSSASNLEFKRIRYNKDFLSINEGSTGNYPYINQLSKSSRDIKVFKYNETYRLGLQFQHETGKWSSPVWLKDAKNTIAPEGDYNTEEEIKVSTGRFYYSLNNSSIINALLSNGYKAVRPVIVYPTDNDRSCICQGVLNPTVYNVGDRANGTTFSQASWFFRPNLPAPVTLDSLTSSWLDFSGEGYSENSLGGIVTTKINNYNGIVVKDAWTEFRHNYFIPHNGDTRAEIQCIEQYPTQRIISKMKDAWREEYDIFLVDNQVQRLETESKYSNNNINIKEHFPELYLVDQSTVTLNSPEIEFNLINQSLLNNSVKLRYVGFIPITGNSQDIDIITNTIPRSYDGQVAGGFTKFLHSKVNLNRLAGRRKLADFHWEDYDGNDSKTISDKYYYNTYPWHRKGSLNNQRTATDGYRSAELKNQKRSNLFFSTNSQYFDTAIDISTNSTLKALDITTPKIFNSTENTTLKLDSPKNSTVDSIIYRGNIDSLLFMKTIDIPDSPDYDNLISSGSNIVSKKGGYYISRAYNRQGILDAEDGVFFSRIKIRFTDDPDSGKFNDQCSIDPVEIKYKSSPHIVFSYNNASDGRQIIAPTIEDINNNSTDVINEKTFWGDSYGWTQDSISFNGGPLYSWLWLVELYRDIDDNIRFGGTSKAALENNNWVVAGDTYRITDTQSNYPTIEWKEGDHYYQRYDCLKTYPYTLEDTNSVVEILSFMCETRVNLDGRYDRNRAQSSNLVMTPNNFNLMNPVYDQQNNFFNYRITEKQYQEIDDYINAITWSKTKTFGEKVDTWTNITLASTLELDGNKGRVESIKRLNNDLIAFQERGISQILYNENVQINTQSGVPVEIANSGKVQGKRYLSSYVGCNNKWSICESPAGLYFIDDNTKGIYLFNGNLTNLSNKSGFSSWTKENLKENNFISYYDPIESEVLFLNNKECLTYSERLGTFTSFYDYTSYTIPINMGNRTLLVGDPLGESELKFYEYHAGKYNDFYGKFKEENGEIVYEPNFKNFSVELIVNPEPTKDKIFSTVEFRADAFLNNELSYDIPFTKIRVNNEYQDTGMTTFNTNNLKKKFRIWRHPIGRDSISKMDRIRNPWTKVLLYNDSKNNNKVVLHDIVVGYFD